MVDQVDRLTIEDGISGPMKAAAEQLRKTAEAADVVEKSVTRAGASAVSLVNRFDSATKLTKTLERAQRDLAAAQDTMAAAVANGTHTQEQANAVLDTLSNRVRAAKTAMDVSGESAARYATKHKQAATAARALSVQIPDIVSGLATGQGVFQIAIQQGQQIAGSFQSAGISFRALGPAVASILSPLVSVGGAVAVGVAGLGALAYSAETTQREMLALQTSLRASRADYAAMATEAEKAARAVASTSGFSTGDARAAASSFAAQPAFQGTQAQLQNLVRTAGDLSAVLGVTLPAAAEELARAMSDPAAVAEQLAKQFGGTIPRATLDMVKSLAAGGDTARAFAVVMGLVQEKTTGAAEASKTELQKALDELGAAFTRTDGQGKSFVTTLGEGVASAAASAVSALASVVRGIENMWEAASRRAPNPGALSGGNAALTPDATGRGVLVNPESGAMGLFQVMPDPGTTKRYGYDLRFQDQNIAAGLTDLRQKLATAPNEDKALANFGGFVTKDPSGYIARVRGANTGSLPADVASQIEYWGQVLGLPPEQIELGKRIAVVESQGRQYAPSSVTPRAATGPVRGAYGMIAEGALSALGQVAVQTGTGVVNTPGAVINEALTRAGNGTATGTAIAAQDDIKLYTSALAELAKQGDTSSASVAKLREALQNAQVAFYNAVGPAEKLVRSLDQQIKGELAVAAAWQDGAAAADHATNVIKAQADALAFAAPGTKQYADTVAVLADRYDALSRARRETAAGSALFDQGQQLEYLQIEAQTIGMSEDARNRTLAAEKERQAIAKTMPGILDEEKERLIANAAAIADSASAIQRQQRAIDELGNIASNIFGQLQNAITNAFISGSGAAVNFGNIAKGAISAVVAEAVKLAIINPLMNSAFGGSRTTLSDTLNALGAATGGGSGGGLFGMLSNAGTGIGAVNTLSGGSLYSSSGLSSAWSGISDYVGLTDLLSTPIYTGSTVAGLSSTSGLLAGGANGMIAEGAISAAGQAAPITVGSALGAAGSVLGGAGAGFAAGSYIGGGVQSSLNKTGPAPTIGAGVGAAGGAVAGAAIGSVVPIIGTAIGALIGGLVGGSGGGALGGLIGPQVASPYSSTLLGFDGGHLTYGGTLSQMADTSAELENLQKQADEVNAYLSRTGTSVAGLGYTQIGQNSPKGTPDPTKFVDLGTPNASGATAFSRLRFSSGNEAVNRAIDGQVFNNLGDLQNVVTPILDFITNTVPALEALKETAVKGTASTALENLNSQFSAAIDKAKSLGMATDNLSAAWADATEAVMDQVNAQTRVTDENLTLRYYSARATNTGVATDALGARLLAFDTAAAHERENLTDSLMAVWGDTIKSTTAFADQMSLLERTLGEERLTITKQYADQIAAAEQQKNERLAASAAGTVGGLVNYAASLSTSSASALSPTAQYAAAADRFNALSKAAAKGDINALGGVAAASDAFLSTSRNINGGGAAYATDYRKVIDVLDRASRATPDTLTASVLQAETRTQTETLVAQLTALKTEVVALRQQVAQSASRPR